MTDTFRHEHDERHGHVLWVGKRHYPVIHWNSVDWPDAAAAGLLATNPAFASTELRHNTRQAVVALENGWTLSTIWGDCSYSDNYGWPLAGGRQEFAEEPALVEVGLLRPGGPEDGGLWCDPFGYVTTDQYHRLVQCASKLPSHDPPPPWTEESGDVEAFCAYVELITL